ncbi:MAG: transcription termination factor NusA [Tannerella sp.]|jgi:N utilization substance protein A|nr:transcription termination factor NusA [Tannerella sp.]
MAKKEETISMIDTLAEFKELKNINKETMINVLEESFRSVIAKMFGTDENYDVIINPEKGDFEIWRNRIAVPDGEVEDANLQISLSDAHKIDPDSEVGEEITDEVHFADFGRRAILNLRQTLASKILELQKDNLFARYKAMIGSIVVADVYQVWKKEILLLDDEGNELLLPKSEQIPGDFYRKGEAVRAVVQRVENDNNNNRIYLSRTANVFLQRLFELEVPEINDGLITIKAIARIPGERAKIAVESYDDRIDPVGACVGIKGSRIRGIVRELRNENIDVVNYTTNTSLFIQRALSPAKITSIKIDEAEYKAEVSLRPEEVSLAIGKGGLNIKLACMLTEYTIDVFRDIEAAGEEDIYLDEFADEIDEWVIEALKNVGCHTAKSVLGMRREDVMERADLEEQTVDEVFAILSAEFEDEYPAEWGDDTIEETMNEQG